MSRGIADYIRKQLNSGYDINTIRSYLVRSGYSASEINEAINSVYGKKTPSHKIAIISVIIVIITSAMLLSFFYLMPADEQSLKFELKGAATTAKPGGKISFSKTFSGFDLKEPVTIQHEILNIRTQEILLSKKESGTVVELVKKTEIDIPENMALGSYVLKSTAIQNNKEKVATLPIRVYGEGTRPEPEPEPTHPDCPASCDDNNRCTEDSCNELTGYKCQHNKITPCCGNSNCEPKENSNNCPEDCRKPADTGDLAGLSPWEKLEKIKELAETNENKASDYCYELEQQAYIDQCMLNIGELTSKETYCGRIKDERTRDICLSRVSEKTKDKTICDRISADNRRDACYMNFVMNNNDYTVCDKVSNQYLKQSCESLRELSAIQQA